MNPRININDFPLLEPRVDLELLPETYVTVTAPFRTDGYDLYRIMFPTDIHDHHQLVRTHRQEATSEPPPMPYVKFIGLILGDQNHQTLRQLLDILRFGAISRSEEENVRSAISRSLTARQAWATWFRYTGGSALHAITTQPL